MDHQDRHLHQTGQTAERLLLTAEEASEDPSDQKSKDDSKVFCKYSTVIRNYCIVYFYFGNNL